MIKIDDYLDKVADLRDELEELTPGCGALVDVFFPGSSFTGSRGRTAPLVDRVIGLADDVLDLFRW